MKKIALIAVSAFCLASFGDTVVGDLAGEGSSLCSGNVSLGRMTNNGGNNNHSNVGVGDYALTGAKNCNGNVAVGDAAMNWAKDVYGSVYIGTTEGANYAYPDTTSINDRQLFISTIGNGTFAINPMKCDTLENSAVYWKNGTLFVNGSIESQGGGSGGGDGTFWWYNPYLNVLDDTLSVTTAKGKTLSTSSAEKMKVKLLSTASYLAKTDYNNNSAVMVSGATLNLRVEITWMVQDRWGFWSNQSVTTNYVNIGQLFNSDSTGYLNNSGQYTTTVDYYGGTNYNKIDVAWYTSEYDNEIYIELQLTCRDSSGNHIALTGDSLHPFPTKQNFYAGEKTQDIKFNYDGDGSIGVYLNGWRKGHIIINGD